MRNLAGYRNSEYFTERNQKKRLSQPHFRQQSSYDGLKGYKISNIQKQYPHQEIYKSSIQQKISDVMKICKGSHPKSTQHKNNETSKENNANVLTFRQQSAHKNNHINPGTINRSKFLQNKKNNKGRHSQFSPSEQKTLTIIDAIQTKAIQQIAKLQKEKNRLVELLSIEVAQKQKERNKRIWLQNQFKKILALLEKQGIRPNTNMKEYHQFDLSKDQLSKLSRIPDKSSILENPISSPQLLIKNIKQYNPERNKEIFQESYHPIYQNASIPTYSNKINNQNHLHNQQFITKKVSTPHDYHENLLQLQCQLEQLQQLAEYYKQNYENLRAIKIQQDEAAKRQFGRLLHAGNEIRQDTMNILQPATFSTNSKYFKMVDTKYQKVSPYFNAKNDYRRGPSMQIQSTKYNFSNKQFYPDRGSMRLTYD